MRAASAFHTTLKSVSQNQLTKFQDVKSKMLELGFFSIPFNVALTSALPEFQLELIKQQSENEPKVIYLNKLLLEFYRVYVSKEEFPNIRA